MALPKIQTPMFFIKIPSLQKELKFRPFLVKEEKLLLMAQQSNDNEEILALTQIINNCCLDNIDVDKLTTFDIEYIFLKLRARSVNNIVKLRYRDTEDDKIYDFELNLDDIEVIFDKDHVNKIQITDEVGVILKYPTLKVGEKVAKADNEGDMLNNILISCIDVIYDKEKVYPAKDSTEQELIEFIENLDTKTFKKIEQFFTTMPKLYHEIKYENSLGHERIIKLSTLKDFFT
jgi:hypothetical protein